MDSPKQSKSFREHLIRGAAILILIIFSLWLPINVSAATISKKTGEIITLNIRDDSDTGAKICDGIFKGELTVRSYNWTSSDEWVTTWVDKSQTFSRVKFSRAGTYTIYCSLTYSYPGSFQTASYPAQWTVKITDSEPAGNTISVTPSSLNIHVGDTRTLSASITGPNASICNWKSSNSNVVKVSQFSGKTTEIVATGSGTAQITATAYDGTSASCHVEVTDLTGSLFVVNDITYIILDKNSVGVESASSQLINCIIPQKVSYDNKEYSVVSIEHGAFSSCSSLTSITLPSSLKEIGASAFNGCSRLTSITFPSSLTKICTYAFDKCSSLTSIILPASLTEIEYSPFSNCSNLSEIKVNSANQFYTADDGVLYTKDMQKIIQYPAGKSNTKFDIPESVTEIGSGAFYGCSSLTTITFPSSVTEIGLKAFSGCSSLTTITLPSSLTEISTWAFQSCSSLTTITLPSSVTRIHTAAFIGCSSLTSITLPSSLTEIRGNAFMRCGNLTSVYCLAETPPVLLPSFESTTLKDGTLYVPKGTKNNYQDSDYWGEFEKIEEMNFHKENDEFEYTYQGQTLSYTILSETDKTVETKAGNRFPPIAGNHVAGNLKIPSVVIYDGEEYTVTAIGENSFLFSEDLTSVDIPNSVITIGASAFTVCENLISVNIPNSVTTIGESAFDGCEQMSSINIPESVISIGSYAFIDCYSLDSIIIPQSVTSISDGSFAHCCGLTTISIPQSVTSIGYGSFSHCYGLTTISIPQSVTSIGKTAFENCSGLTEVRFCGSIASVGNELFKDCDAIRLVENLSTDPFRADDGMFEAEVYQNATLRVPKESIEKYRSITPWSNFKNIKESEPEKWEPTSEIGTIDVGDDVEIRGWVTAIDTRGFVLTDASGSVLCYQANGFSVDNVAIGDRVTLSGTVSAYNKGLQIIITDDSYVVDGASEYTYPEPKHYTGAMLDEALNRDGNKLAEYITITGKARVNGNYYDFIVDGAETAQGSGYMVPDNIRAMITSDEEYTITGYFIHISGGRFVNIVITEVTERGPSGISVSTSKSQIYIGESATVSAELIGGTGSVTWTANNSNVSISGAGNSCVVTGLFGGTSRITATTNNGHSDYVDITILKHNKVVVTPSSLNIHVGDRETLSAAITGSNSSTCTWNSSNPNVVKVSSSSGKTTEVVATGVGTAQVTATAYDGTSASCYVEVTESGPEKWKPTSVIGTIDVGDDVEIRGWVTAISSRGFILTDESGSVLCYQGSSFSVDNVSIGDRITLSGTVGSYDMGLQIIITDDSYVVDGASEYRYPEPKHYTGAMLDAALNRDGNKLAEYISITGKARVNGNYYDFIVDGAEAAQGSGYWVPDNIREMITSDREYTITGYFITISGGRFANIVITTVTPTGGVGKVSDVDNDDIDYSEPYEIYNLSGMLVGRSIKELINGVYIVRQGATVNKIVVK